MSTTTDTRKRKSTSSRSSSGKKIILLKLKERVFKLDKKRIVLGSVISADVRVTGEGVSPIHAVLELSESDKGKWQGTIFDLASDSGVFVNGKKTVTQVLEDGDKITLGRHQLEFALANLSDHSDKEITKEMEGRTFFLNPDEDLKPLILEDEREVVEIFDFRPTSKRALEVVMSWYGTILTVEHFIHEKSVTIGNTRKSDFGIPPLLSSNQYPIVIQSGGGFVLNLDSQMKGVMHSKGQLLSLDEVRSQTMRGSQGFEVPLGNDDFAKISIGSIDFYFSYTAAPPKLKRRKLFERDPFFLRVFFSSMALSGLVFFSMTKIDVSKNIDAEQVPERIATILYQPEKFMTPPPVPVEEKPKPKPPEPKVETSPPPKPTPKATVKVVVTPKAEATHKPPPKVMAVAPEPKKPVPQATQPPAAPAKPAAQNKPKPQAEAKEGEGARAKGAEGSRGEVGLKKTNQKVTELSRPSPNAADGKGASGNSQVEDEGNVDILKGAGGKIQNILGNSAAHLGDGSQNLKGFGNFSTGGNGGLGLAGSGHGGGGDAETTLGGLGKKGSGMGRVGTGRGAAGNGTGIVGSQVRVAIRTDGPEEAVVMGSIDRNAIAEAIYAHKDEFRLCYEREINAEHPTLAGQVGTSFVIGASGRVTQAGIESTSLNNANAERCILNVLKRIDFPVPQGGGVVEVHFPFKFSAAGK